MIYKEYLESELRHVEQSLKPQQETLLEDTTDHRTMQLGSGTIRTDIRAGGDPNAQRWMARERKPHDVVGTPASAGPKSPVLWGSSRS